MAGKIFISYRRDDDPGFAHALFGRLESEFTGDALFMDVDMDAGVDFVRVLETKVAECDVLLAIIGERWIDARDPDGARRLEKADDFVRIEIASALRLGKRVIPVLVNKAEMPRADELPQSLKPLARRNAVAIRPVRFKADSQGLINAVKDAVAQAEAERAAKTEAERAAAEAERKRREAEEEARAAQFESVARTQAQAGLSTAEIRKVQELAIWDYIKDKTDPAEFRNHLSRFPGGVTERDARETLEALVWKDWKSGVVTSNDAEDAMEMFLGEFPNGVYADQAREILRSVEGHHDRQKKEAARRRQETEAWGKVAASTDKAEIEAFLTAWPGGVHAADAKARLKELRGGRITRRGVLQGIGIGVGSSALAYLTFVPGELIWRQFNDQSLRTLSGHTDTVTSVAFSADGRLALSGSWDNTLKLWDVGSGRELRTLSGHTSLVRSVAFSADGRLALSGSDDKTLKLWDVASGQELRTLSGHTGLVLSVALSADGRLALSGSGDKTLKLWDVATGKELRTLSGHTDWVWSVAISPDGRLALSESYDSTLKLWDVSSGRELRTLSGHASRVVSVAFSAGGRFALSGSGDKTLKLWDVSPYTAAR